MHLNFSSVTPAGTTRPGGKKVLTHWALCCAMLGTGVAHSQINDTDGVWRGSLSCGEVQVRSSRSAKAFVIPLTVSVSLGAMTGRRDTAKVLERFTGSIERSGRASLDGIGHWKDDPTRSWRYHLRGSHSGFQATLTGPMESQDGKVKLRDCQLKLASAAVERKEQPAVTRPVPATHDTAVKPAPSAETAARSAEMLNKDSERAARQAAEKKLDAVRATEAKRQSEEAAAATAKARAAELEALRLRNLQLESEKAAAERVASDRAASERAAATERAAAERAATERAASDKAAADKAARQKADTEAKKAPIKVRSAMDL